MKDTQFIVRCSGADKAKYEAAAASEGKKFSAWVLDAMDFALTRRQGATPAVPVAIVKPVSPPPSAPLPPRNKKVRKYTGISYKFNGRLMYEYEEDGKLLTTSEPPCG